MNTLSWIVIFSLLTGVVSVLAASAFLLIPENWRHNLLPHLVSFAIGSLLGAAFLGLLPHATETTQNSEYHALFMTLLLGLLSFFLLEKMVLWRHCHTDHCEAHAPDAEHINHNSSQAAGTLVLIGDGVHNLVDGVLISAAFLTDIHLGVVTAIAIGSHEIPQEVGDFIILLHSGFSRAKALFYNILSSLATLVGALIAYYSLEKANQYLPYMLAIAASSFIYVAMADLLPSLHKRVELKHTVQQITLILAGALMIYATHASLHVD